MGGGAGEGRGLKTIVQAGPIHTGEVPTWAQVRSALRLSVMKRAQAASEGDQAEFPMEPLGSQVAEPEQLQVPADELRLEGLESGPNLVRAVKKAAGAGQDLAGGKQQPPARPALTRLPPSSLGYGAFRRQTSADSEPPSPGPSVAERPHAGEAPGAELVSGEQLPGAWAPVELQVDVRVKSVGAAGSSRAPSPAPSTRFLTVPVPESPASSRHAFPTHPLLPRTPARPERGLDAEGRASPADGRAEPAGSPTTCGGRCRELGLEKEDALLPRAETDSDEKLPRAIEIMGKRAPAPGARAAGEGATQPERSPFPAPRRPPRCPGPAWPVPPSWDR